MMVSPVMLAIGGVFLLTVMDAVLKAQLQIHSVAVVLFCRFVAGGCISLAVLAWLKPQRPTATQIRANLLRAPLVVLTAGSFFLAVSLLPLAEAISLSFLAPCFIAVLGVIWLKEQVDRSIIIALAAGLAGVLTMLWPNFSAGMSGSVLGVGAALASALFYAVNIILLRQLAVSQNPAIIVAFQTIAPAILIAPLAWWFWTPQSLADIGFSLVAGTIGVAGH